MHCDSFLEFMFDFLALSKEERKINFEKLNKGIKYNGITTFRFSYKPKKSYTTMHFLFNLLEDNTINEGKFFVVKEDETV